jgi:hypothetical protein
VVSTQLANGESTVVDLSTLNLKIEGLNHAIRRGKMAYESGIYTNKLAMILCWI